MLGVVGMLLGCLWILRLRVGVLALRKIDQTKLVCERREEDEASLWVSDSTSAWPAAFVVLASNKVLDNSYS